MAPEKDPNDDRPCDGLDNDCDDTVDEGFNVGTPCVGKSALDEPIPCDPCVGLRANEICHADEDCDGASNEGFACNDGDPDKLCQSQPIVCEPGEQTCVGGKWSECAGEKLGTAEICNGADDNCNGTADDGFNVGTPCVGKSALDEPIPCDPCVGLRANEICHADEDCDGCKTVSDDGTDSDNDGDGYPAACGDSNDNDASVNPDALDASCDGKDKKQ